MATRQSYGGEISALTTEYRQKGHNEAAEHRPPSDAIHPDQYETAVRAEAEKWINGEQYLFDRHVSEAGKAAVETRQRLIDLDSRAQQLVSDTSLQATIEAEMAGERRALVAATEARVRAEVDWRAFRVTNRIQEAAHYPESRVWHFAIVAVFALIETAVNAFFFENAQGLLGGFTVALGVSMVNMGSAMALGAGFRFKNLAATEKKTFGWLCLATFIVVAVYCNAVFAAFRSEYQVLIDPTDPLQLRSAFAASMAEAKRVFILDMAVADLMSFILFGFGLLLSGLAFWKGYTFDDRFPGYGRRDRGVKAARHAEVEIQDQLRQKIKDFLLARRGDVNGAMNEPGGLAQRLAAAIAALTNSQATLRAQCDAVQRDFKLVIEAYRQANSAVRGTDAPKYFASVDDLTLQIRPDSANEILADLRAVQSEVGSLRERIHQPLSDKLILLQQNASQVLTSTFTEFLRDVETEAKEKIDGTVQSLR